MTDKTSRELIQELFCCWCGEDCLNLTQKEKMACVASNRFIDELKSLGYVQKAEDQSLPPFAYFSQNDFITKQTIQQDMLKANFVKVEEEVK